MVKKSEVLKKKIEDLEAQPVYNIHEVEELEAEERQAEIEEDTESQTLDPEPVVLDPIVVPHDVTSATAAQAALLAEKLSLVANASSDKADHYRAALANQQAANMFSALGQTAPAQVHAVKAAGHVALS